MINNKYRKEKVFWQRLRYGCCPKMGCEGKIVKKENSEYYICDSCPFIIGSEKFFKLSAYPD